MGIVITALPRGCSARLQTGTFGEVPACCSTAPPFILGVAANRKPCGRGLPSVDLARLQDWTGYLNVGEFDVTRFLSSESEMLKWKAEGLPADNLSSQNAVVILNSTARSPLIIDPSTQASEWLKQHLKVAGANIDVSAARRPIRVRMGVTTELR
jgi:hypothetical protein